MTWLETGNVILSVFILIQSGILIWVVNRLVILGWLLRDSTNLIDTAGVSGDMTPNDVECVGGEKSR